MAKLGIILAIALILVLVSSVRNVAEHDRFALFENGRYESLAGPGWVFMPPLVQSSMMLSLEQKGEMTGPGEALFGTSKVPVMAPDLAVGEKVQITGFVDQTVHVGPLTSVK